MTEPRVLILFHTVEGQSERIALSIGATLRGAGFQTDVRDVSDAPPLDGYDGVVVGDSIHAVKHSRQLKRYLRDHATTLNEIPTALFQVSLTSTNPDAEHTAAARALVDELLEKTGLRPTFVAMFAGRLAYSQYGWLKRLVMVRIVRHEGGDTDTTQDYEYTDWAAVEDFAQRFAEAVTTKPARTR